MNPCTIEFDDYRVVIEDDLIDIECQDGTDKLDVVRWTEVGGDVLLQQEAVLLEQAVIVHPAVTVASHAGFVHVFDDERCGLSRVVVGMDARVFLEMVMHQDAAGQNTWYDAPDSDKLALLRLALVSITKSFMSTGA